MPAAAVPLVAETTGFETVSGQKSQGSVLALAVLLGCFGAHRFYTGHQRMGVLYLLTLGLCGIGWFIDIFMIATNRYKDSLGRPLNPMGSKTSKIVNFFLLGILFGGIFTRVTGSTDAGLILGYLLAGIVISGRTLWNWALSKIQNKVS